MILLRETLCLSAFVADHFFLKNDPSILEGFFFSGESRESHHKIQTLYSTAFEEFSTSLCKTGSPFGISVQTKKYVIHPPLHPDPARLLYPLF